MKTIKGTLPPRFAQLHSPSHQHHTTRLHTLNPTAAMCGKGVDQTMRSSQRWQVIALELQERHSLGEELGLYFEELKEALFTDEIDFDVWGALARPVLPAKPSEEMLPRDDGEESHPCRMSLGMFDLLSNELIHIIIDNLSQSDDDRLIALGLTC